MAWADQAGIDTCADCDDHGWREHSDGTVSRCAHTNGAHP
jgi:hypothetical protein